MQTLVNDTEGWIQFIIEDDQRNPLRWVQWYPILLLLLFVGAALRPLTTKSLLSFALPVIGILLWWGWMRTPSKCRDMVTVIKNVGIQVATSGSLGGTKVRLLEWPTIREVLIVEGARRFQYIFYMVVRLTDPKADLVVLFPNALPRLATLEVIRREILARIPTRGPTQST